MSTEAYEIDKTARSGARYTGFDFIKGKFSKFVGRNGDRRYSDDSSIIGGVAYLNDRPVAVIAIEKGHNARERMQRSFGMPNPEGYRKALRLMKQAEKFHRPVICFVDTAGAYCGIGAEERGQGLAIAENLSEMMTLNTPVISILIGEGGSGGALALSVADRVYMLENAVYSVISPEGCASILWKDAAKAPEAAQSLKLTAKDALSLGIIEDMISEENMETPEFFIELRDRLAAELDVLRNDSSLLAHRYQRFRRIGSAE